MELTITPKTFFVSGKPFEMWDNPDQPFGWTPGELHKYAMNGDWELLFNALVIAASAQAATE